MKNKIFIGIFLIFTSMGLISMKPAETYYDPSGNWSYEIEAGEDILTGLMSIKKVKDSYEVEIESNVYGTLILDNVAFNKTNLTANVDVQGIDTDFDMDFDKDSMSGTITYDGQELPLSAERK